MTDPAQDVFDVGESVGLRLHSMGGLAKAARYAAEAGDEEAILACVDAIEAVRTSASDEIEALVRRMSGEASMEILRDMNEAPRDGTAVLLFRVVRESAQVPGNAMRLTKPIIGGVRLARWRHGGWVGLDGHEVLFEPAFWLPVPELPEGGAE